MLEYSALHMKLSLELFSQSIPYQGGRFKIRSNLVMDFSLGLIGVSFVEDCTGCKTDYSLY